MHAVLNVVVLAAAYFVAGELGLLLATPPGYASAVWPASGIALAGLLIAGVRAWPGVAIGSFLVSAHGFFGAEPFVAPVVPLVIGLGAALQAATGAALVRRAIGFPNLLEAERDIVWFLVLGGPFACLVNSLIGVSTLVAADAIPVANFAFSWWTWWVGDVIGVLVFAPLVLILFGAPRDAWRARRRVLALPLLVTFVLVALMIVVAGGQEQRRIEAEFARRANVLLDGLRDSLGDQVQSLRAIESFFSASVRVERHEFRSYVRRLIANTPGVLAFSWNPRVADAERGANEEQARADGLGSFQITERDADGRLVRAARRAEYVPVLYIEPLADNAAAVGFDIASDAGRRAALEIARDTGAPVVTQRLRLVQASGEHEGVLLLLPIYNGVSVPETPEQRRAALRGFVVGVFRLHDMIGTALARTGVRDISVRIEDAGADPGLRTLYGAPAAAATRRHGAGSLLTARTVDFAQRRWTLTFESTPDFAAGLRSWAAVLVLAAGVLLSGLVGGFLLILTGRTMRIERVVAERTAVLSRTNQELARINADMTREIAARKQFEAALEVSNRELDAFSYSVSHDLRSPLRAINGFSALIAADCGAGLDGTCRGYLDRIRAATVKMGGLIEDLLRLSRVTRSALQPVTVNAGTLFRQVVDELRLRDRDRNVTVSVQDDCVARADAQLLRIALENLAGNAWKFTRGRGDAHIEFGCAPQRGETVFFVRDNGAGFDMAYSGKLFQAFQRLHAATDFEGSGIGLSIVQRIIHRHGGRVWAQSEPERGATFYFALPS
jgi:signal transduction histidine kinase